VEARDFDNYAEMIAWEKELENRIAAQIGELPDDLAREVIISERAGEWAIGALILLKLRLRKT